MNRRAFTLAELLIVIAIIVIIAAVAIPNIVAAREKAQLRQKVSTPVTTQVTPSNAALSPERPSGYEVHTVNVPCTNNPEATQIHETLVSWLREHPGHEIISTIRTTPAPPLHNGSLVIVTKNR